MTQTPRSTATDVELMKAYQGGDADAFELLYQRHSGRVYGFLRKRLQKKEEVDEVFQQIFIKFHSSRHQYDPTYSLTQWIFVMAKTVLLDHWRKVNRQLDQPAEQSVEEDPRAVTLSSSYEGNEAQGGGRQDQVPGFEGLSLEQKEVIQLRVQEELDYEEIAKRIGKSQTSVRQILSRALRKLRAAQSSPEGSNP